MAAAEVALGVDARVAMQLAKQEAQRLCHEYIGTEHILLGLIKGGQGKAAAVLKGAGLDIAAVRAEVEKIALPGVPAPGGPAGGRLPLTPRSAAALCEAEAIAKEVFHTAVVGGEHLLVGLARDREGVAGAVLAKFGLDAAAILFGLVKTTWDGVGRPYLFVGGPRDGQWWPVEVAMDRFRVSRHEDPKFTEMVRQNPLAAGSHCCEYRLVALKDEAGGQVWFYVCEDVTAPLLSLLCGYRVKT